MTDAPRKPNVIEQLVAYLDGELDGEQSAGIEKHLSEDPKLRQLAEELDRTWGMLDALESVEASQEFSAQTMKTVAAADMDSQQRFSALVSRFAGSWFNSHALTWFGIGVIGTSCGLAISLLSGASPESTQAAELLRDIDVLQRYPEYSIVPDVELLRELKFPSVGPSLSQEQQ
ncbi:MAG: zf-HC2 domain-containing protein [Fuerstiella sp.]|nr:zf-HC2 domain-containing protein [Fuerstiella sp.]